MSGGPRVREGMAEVSNLVGATLPGWVDQCGGADLLMRETLSNRYFAMRHGHATSNAAGVLVSTLEHDRRLPGLTEAGRAQVRDSIRSFLTGNPQVVSALDRLEIFCSPLSRAEETAAITQRQIEEQFGYRVPVSARVELIDRAWGHLEGQPVEQWVDLRDADVRDPVGAPFGAEPVVAMYRRASSLIGSLEQERAGSICLLVSHCDQLQAFEAVFQRSFAELHYSEHPPLRNAEVRELRLGGRPR